MGQEHVLAEQYGLEGWHTCVENATSLLFGKSRKDLV